jgi:hypothetical protein
MTGAQLLKPCCDNIAIPPTVVSSTTSETWRRCFAASAITCMMANGVDAKVDREFSSDSANKNGHGYPTQGKELITDQPCSAVKVTDSVKSLFASVRNGPTVPRSPLSYIPTSARSFAFIFDFLKDELYLAGEKTDVLLHVRLNFLSKIAQINARYYYCMIAIYYVSIGFLTVGLLRLCMRCSEWPLEPRGWTSFCPFPCLPLPCVFPRLGPWGAISRVS